MTLSVPCADRLGLVLQAAGMRKSAVGFAFVSWTVSAGLDLHATEFLAVVRDPASPRRVVWQGHRLAFPR